MRVLASVVVAWQLVGCSGGEDIDLSASAEEIVTVLALADVEGPQEVTSKSLTYLTSTGVAPGAPEEISDRAEDTLAGEGWSIRPSGDDAVVVASRDGVAAQIAAFARRGVNPAPEGSSWVQVSVAEPTEQLEWAKP
ncbi:hypothetical protein BH20ACT2_BH20ACT2_19100 [soil metagenome]